MIHKTKRRVMGFILSAVLILQGVTWNVHAETKITTSAEEHVNIGIIADNQRSVNFNKNWKFIKGDTKDAEKQEFNDAGWRSLELPHDYSIEGEFTTKGEAESGFLLGGVGWYRKRIAVPKKYEGKNITLDFDGVYMNADVYVNGKKLGNHPYGYTPFSFDISSNLIYDGITENVIAVRVNNNVPTSRWYSGSGIYRDVNLTITDKIRVAQDGQYITTPELEREKNGTVNVVTKTTIVNGSNKDSTLVIKQSILDAKGSVVTMPVQKNISLNKEEKSDIEMNLSIHKPALWSIESPTMYQVKTEVLQDGKALDTYVSDFGFRHFSFDRDTGFSLNGKNVKLNGVSMHHDQGALGAVANERAVERQVQKLKAMGSNAIRVTHNPASRVLLDVANREGMLIIDEAFDGWARPKNGNSNDFSAYFNKKIGTDNEILHGSADMTWAEFEAKTMVRRAQNDPAIIMWSIGNEIAEGSGDDGRYPEYARNIISWIQSIDRTRPVTIGDNHSKDGNAMYKAVSSIIADAGGIVGLNYSSVAQYDKLYKNNPNWKIYGAETSSAIRSRGIYNTKGHDRVNMHLSSYDSIAVGWGELANKSMKTVLSKDYIAGEFVWTGFDYIGEPTPYNGTGPGSVSGKGARPKSSYFGIIDTAGFEKDVYYLYQSQWNSDLTTLHVLPTWNEENLLKAANGNVEVNIYSNAPEVELFLNDTSLGKKKMIKQTTAAGHAYFTDENGNMFLKYNVPYKKGTLRAVAYDENGNVIDKTSGRNVIKTSDRASSLSLKADRSTIQANGKDLSYITVDVKDSDGNEVTHAKNKIDFSIVGDGKIVGVDNGDPTDTDSYKGTSRKAFSGKALVIVQSTRNAGEFTITASGNGLQSENIRVRTEKVTDESSVYMESYKIAKHHYVGINERPQLPTSVPVTFSNGNVTSYDIVWDAYDRAELSKPQIFKVQGKLKGTDVSVSVDIHVLGNIVSVVQPSLFMFARETLKLPETVPGILEDGTLTESFPVTWEAVTPDKYAQEGQFEARGTVQILDKTKAVTASVRVAKALPAPVNIASNRYVDPPALSESTVRPSDNLLSINNGVVNSQSTNERWTNWNDRNLNQMAYITMEWQETYTIDKVNLWLFTDNNAAALPKEVVFEYFDDKGEWINIPATSTTPVSFLSGETTYLFDEPVSMKRLRIGMLQETGKCIGLTEAMVYEHITLEESKSTASLESIMLDGNPLADFTSERKEYTLSIKDEPIVFPVVKAKSIDNAGVTILPVHQGKTKILVVSENGKNMATYTILYDLPVNLTVLQQVFNKANGMMLQQNLYLDNDVWKEFTKLYAEANKMLNLPTTQIEIDALGTKLTNIMKDVSYILMEGSEEQVFLQRFVNKVNATSQASYSRDNYAFLQSVKGDAVYILHTKAYTAPQIQNVNERITHANNIIDNEKLPVVDNNNNMGVPQKPGNGTLNKNEIQNVNTGDSSSTSKSLLYIVCLISGGAFIFIKFKKSKKV